MRRRGLFAVACVAFGASAAWAQDARVLGRDDIEFAQALAANGYGDLAARLLQLIEEKGDATALAVCRKTRLDIEQAEARKIDDPIRRRDALVAVLHGRERFVDEFKDAPAAVEVGDAVPDLCVELAETIAAAIRQAKDAATVEAIRSEGDSLLQRAEQWLLQRIDAFKARGVDSDNDERILLLKREYDHARTLYVHALVFERGSERRVALCKQSLEELESVDCGGFWDDPPLWIYRAYVYAGLCLCELGKTNEAVQRFDNVICLRRSFGDPDATTGVYPIPAGARDIVDLVCYAVLQKMLVLRDAKKPDEAVAAGKDYLATTPRPFDVSTAMLLAKTLGDAQFANDDTNGAAETARRMIREDPDGVGGRWGRELLDRGTK